MLSRTADHLVWMARYSERAENTARLLAVHYQTNMLPQSDAAALQGWEGLLGISELLPSYRALLGPVSAQGVMDFMVCDTRNPSSIVCCLGAARENARAVRGALSTELWETQNGTWLELQRMLRSGEPACDPGAFLEWVKLRSHLLQGVTSGTMQVGEALHFMRVGSFLECADNTARLVDVKFHGVEGDGRDGGDPRDQDYDFYHWSAVLRSVSGLEVYRKAYRDVVRPERVAELLILRPDMPRSLRASLCGLVQHLQWVAADERSESLRRAGKMHAELQYGRIEEILDTGLHLYLTYFLDRINDLGLCVSREFLLAPALAPLAQ